MPPDPFDGPSEWVSVSDLAEQAYCPRAEWYRHHPPLRAPTYASRAASERGRRFHEHTLAGVERRAASGAGAAVAAILIGLAILVGLLWSGAL